MTVQMGVNPHTISAKEATAALANLSGWQLAESGKAISKHYHFKNFAEALSFVNRLGALAEAHNHHPDLTLGWGYVGVTFTTHDIGGLRAADFKMAEEAEALLAEAV
jgi:4a-hydroxytetrahydrobiopterin dehydratase